MGMPEEEEREVPSYMVSFGDMITLLLTFFILLVALADTQQAGLVGAGQGPIIPHLLADGAPGIMKGRLIENRQKHKRDMWWVPSQEGDPDQLERVTEKLDRELGVKFKPGDASVSYEQDELILRLPARIDYDSDNKPILTPEVEGVLAVVAEETRTYPERYVRINADVAQSGHLELELRDSAVQARMIYDSLLRRGVSRRQLSIWAWGASRPISNTNRDDSVNRGVTIEIFRSQTDGED